MIWLKYGNQEIGLGIGTPPVILEPKGRYMADEVVKSSIPSPLLPSATLLVKLGSIIVHMQELMSPEGHIFDKHALDTLWSDPEVVAWIAAMDKMAFLPKKR